MRPEIFQGNRERGRKLFGLTGNAPVVMVVGGSTGARAINEAVRAALPQLTANFQVLHLCGKGNKISTLDGTTNYVQCEYLNEEMADAYACADILIARAGANALCELLELKKPALLIPYPLDASRGDQVLNAESFEKRGYSYVLQQSDMTPEKLVSETIRLYKERGALYDAMHADKSGGNGLEAVLEQIYKYAKT